MYQQRLHLSEGCDVNKHQQSTGREREVRHRVESTHLEMSFWSQLEGLRDKGMVTTPPIVVIERDITFPYHLEVLYSCGQ